MATLQARNLQDAGGNLFSGAMRAPTGKVFTARAFVEGARFFELDRRQSYYDCTQHDYKRWDFDGRIMQAGGGSIGYTQPNLTEKSSTYIPLRLRRPSAPYRLARAIVNAFTNFVFGEGRFPAINVPGDEDSQDFLQTVTKVGKLPLWMIRARNVGGSTGTVGLSWAYVKGRPRFRVHNAKNLFVHEWQDRSELVPRHVTECFQVVEEEWNDEKQLVENIAYWHRRDWTMSAEIVFHPARVEPGKEPDWEQYIDTERSVIHDDQDPHFVWIQNSPSDQVDGLPDYDGLYESLDELDTLLSVIVRGAKLNLDPTLVLKADLIQVARMGVKKGSDNALVVDKEGGDAKYLELAGSSIEAGLKLFNEHRRTILEVAECVIPDPDTIAAQGQSAAAQKMVFSRMLSKGGTTQEQYGSGIERLLEPALSIAQARVQVPVTLVDPDSGQEVPADHSFDLPPRVEQKDVLGDDGQPTGEQEPNVTERHPGEGTNVEVEWPPRFPPTALDQQQVVTTLSTATGGKPFLSQQTATEIATQSFGREPADEWAKVQSMQKDDDAKEQAKAGQMDGGGAGGAVASPKGLPPGASPKPPGGGAKPPGGGKDGADKDESESANP